ncbi:MAG TPA: MBOAT family protein [Chloroflexota bacterium]|nr:MBOAT family protein [Chloroflexota bacterium]
MLFPTLTFTLFFLTVYPICWLLRWRHWAWKLFVLLASYVFYGSWDRRFVLLIFLSSVLNYAAARALYRQGQREEGAAPPRPAFKRRAGRRAVLLAALVFNLGLLGVFKYYGFFVESLNEALRGAGFGGRLPFVEVIVPVGISFFTFQAISYVVDVYRGSLAPGRWLDFAVYLAFFPHLVAGPIVRASEFLPQLHVPRTLLPRNATRAALLIGRGLFKKVVISSYVATAIVDPVFGVPGQHSSPEILLAIYGYAVQIYADFSGYTDIAIGIALLLGIRFPQNFDRPYSAVSLQDFWRRWHMTLSRWLRDYLYIPLGGSRHGTLATYRNLMVTMALGGLWHGASLTFLAWGVFHGIGLALERLIVALTSLLRPSSAPTTPGDQGAAAPGTSRPAGLPGWASGAGARWLSRLVTFNLVCVGWVLFRADSLSTAWELLARSVTAWGPAPLVTGSLVAVIGAVLASQFLPASVGARAEAAFGRLPLPLQGAALGAFCAAVVAFGPQGVAPFIYYQF